MCDRLVCLTNEPHLESRAVRDAPRVASDEHLRVTAPSRARPALAGRPTCTQDRSRSVSSNGSPMADSFSAFSDRGRRAGDHDGSVRSDGMSFPHHRVPHSHAAAVIARVIAAAYPASTVWSAGEW